MAINTWGVSPTTWGHGNWGKQNECTVVVTGQEITTSPGTLQAYNQTGWGRQFWGDNDWGIAVDQTDVAVTGIEITTSLGTVDAYNSEGWGRYFWGEEDWGNTGVSVIVTLTGLSTTAATGTPVVEDDIEVGWGRKTWGNLAWGDAYSAALLGQQITSAIGSATTKAGAIVKPTAQTITPGYGLVDIECDATYVHVHDPEITSSIGTVLAYVQPVSVTGLEITSGITAATVVGGVDVGPTAQTITSGFGSTFRAFTDITIRPTALTISSGLGTVDVVSKVEVSGQAITSSLGTVTTIQTAVIKPTGIEITSGVGTANAIAWAIVDTGTTVTYSEVNTGSTVTWTDIAA